MVQVSEGMMCFCILLSRENIHMFTKKGLRTVFLTFNFTVTYTARI
jgi:hypothetical protein